jgi:class 3 adenylate cyclase/tetratricopeptide (TPR) repeat protein
VGRLYVGPAWPSTPAYTSGVPVCPSCGEDNPERARFCLACSAPLPSAAAAVRKERKFAATLFADLVGSTAMAEREDPEVVQAVVNRAFDRLSEEVERYGGLLEKFMGDAILAVFGVPTAHEDDPERAVRAAIEMQAVLGELNRGFASENRPKLQMRIGVEAGEVLVDLERAAGQRERMITGDAVNVAARLQTAAEPWQIVVGPAIYAATKNVIDYRELEPLTLKGKQQPVPAWQALRVKARRRGERPSLGMEAKLVGRDGELGLLKQTFHRVEAEGRPALVTVLGTAGVGKSRLAYELLRYLDSLPTLAYWRKGRCLAYGNVSYSALAEAVKAQCEILEDDAPDVVAGKARGAVEALFDDDAIVPHIGALVGAGATGQFSREDLFDAWRRFLERMAGRLPFVLVLEDIHWADTGLLDFIEHLADWAQGPLLVLILARPELLELRPGWGGGKRNYSAIYLEPLTPAQNEAMLEDLLGGQLPEELRQLVTERSEGNPLYTEEIVRMFVDQGILRATKASRLELARPVAQVDVPRSIQALIATRLDGLPADEKSLLQDAAVVGRAFWGGAVARLAGRDPAGVRQALGRLRVKEIITPREPPTFAGELEFAFRHVLIRDVAYESLPKTLRAAKHVEVARWAEERSGDKGQELAEVMAAHYLQAVAYREELGERPEQEMDAAASRWAGLAGDRAWRLWQQAEALRWYRAALDSGERSALPTVDLARLSESIVKAAFGLESFSGVRSAAEAALGRFEEVGDQAGMGRMEAAVAKAAFEGADEESVLPWANRAIARLDALGDSPDLAETLEIVGNYHRRRGRIKEAEPLLRRAVEIASRSGARVIQGQACLSLGIAVLHRGSVREGMALVEEGYAISQEAGDLQLSLRASNTLASCSMDYAPDYERGWAVMWKAIELSQRSGRRDFEGWLWQNVGNYAYDQGRLEEIERAARASFEIGEALGYAHVLLAGWYYVAVAAFLRADLDEAERALRKWVESDWIKHEIQGVPYGQSLRGEIAMARGQLDEAIEAFRHGVDRVGEELMLGMADELLFHLVRALVAAGRPEEAAEPLEHLRRVAPERPNSEAFLAWAEGLVNADPERLRAAIETFNSLGLVIDEARCLMDLATMLRASGQGDGLAEDERARELLSACGVTVFTPA